MMTPSQKQFNGALTHFEKSLQTLTAERGQGSTHTNLKKCIAAAWFAGLPIETSLHKIESACAGRSDVSDQVKDGYRWHQQSGHATLAIPSTLNTTQLKPAPKPRPMSNSKRMAFMTQVFQSEKALGRKVGSKDLIALSPIDPSEVTTADWLLGLYPPDALIVCGSDKTIKAFSTAQQARRLSRKHNSTIMFTATFTGQEAKTERGHTTNRRTEYIETPPYYCAEFDPPKGEPDKFSLEWQFAFWFGIIQQNILPVRSLVYSGNKSIHALIDSQVMTPAEYRKVVSPKFAKNWSGELSGLGLDDSAYKLLHGTRLANVYRDNGKLQRLLYFDPTFK